MGSDSYACAPIKQPLWVSPVSSSEPLLHNRGKKANASFSSNFTKVQTLGRSVPE